MAILDELRENVIAGNAPATQEGVNKALEEGLEPGTILQEGLIPAMAEVGRRFEEGEAYVPEMLIAARAMQAGLSILRPLLVETGVEPLGKVAIGTVKGDLHDIGKNLVSMMLEGAGFDIVDLKVDVGPDNFVNAAKEGVDAIAMSALLTTTMPSMKTTIEALEEAGVRDSVKVVIGGAPVTQAFAEEIGADGYAPDASSAVRKVKELLGV
jgi:5-methyltetrahydrofolate--homocysteine methyltransferase